MKTLAFLFLAALIVLLAGLVLNEGHSSPRPRPSSEEVFHGSANLIKDPPIKSQQAAPQQRPEIIDEKISPSELILAMESDNFCEAASALNKFNVYGIENSPALVQSVGASPALRELFSPKGPLFNPTDSLPQPKSKLARFFLSLRLGGHLSYGSLGARNFERAREILLELEKEEPGNAAYPLFRLANEKSLKYPDDKLETTARKISSGSYFDTLLVDALGEIEPLRWQSATHHYVITGFLNYYHIPYTSIAVNDLQDLDRRTGQNYAADLGQLMMQKGRQSNRDGYFLDYSPAEYDEGRMISKSTELESSGLSAERTGQTMPWPPYVGQPCDRSIYDQYFETMRSIAR